jgi:pimeloyl-ACP methyl ester carboxylesterase
VLVGASFGGLNMQLYAYTYPNEVTGLVLVDSMHPDQFQRYPPARQDSTNTLQQFSVLKWLSLFGVTRLFGLFDQGITQHFSSAVQPQVRALMNQTRFPATGYDEMAVIEQSCTQVGLARAHHSLGHLPLVVLVHGIPLAQGEAEAQALQRDFLSLSSSTTLIMAAHSGHAIAFDQPHLVIAAIKQVVTQP